MDFIELIEHGGPMLWLVLTALLCGATFGVERLFALTRAKCAPKDFEKDTVHIADTKGMDAAVSHCRQKPSALGRVLSAALIRHGAPLINLETAARNETRLALQSMLRNTAVCGWMALLLPLLGFGAVGVATLTRLLPISANENLGDGWTVLILGALDGIPALTMALLSATLLLLLFAYTRERALRLATEIEVRAIDAIVTLDRKARQSIRLVEDLEDRIKTESMIKIPDLSAEFDEQHHALESSAKTAVTTHASMPADSPAGSKH